MVLAIGIKPEKELLKCLLKCPEASGDFCSAWTRMLYFHLFPRTSTVPVFKTKQKQLEKKQQNHHTQRSTSRKDIIICQCMRGDWRFNVCSWTLPNWMPVQRCFFDWACGYGLFLWRSSIFLTDSDLAW